jgi:hypothetical protein
MKLTTTCLKTAVFVLLAVMVLSSAGCFYGEGGGREGDHRGDPHEQHDDHHDDDRGRR